MSKELLPYTFGISMHNKFNLAHNSGTLHGIIYYSHSCHISRRETKSHGFSAVLKSHAVGIVSHGK